MGATRLTTTVATFDEETVRAHVSDLIDEAEISSPLAYSGDWNCTSGEIEVHMDTVYPSKEEAQTIFPGKRGPIVCVPIIQTSLDHTTRKRAWQSYAASKAPLPANAYVYVMACADA